MRARATILAALVIGSVIAMDPGGYSPFGPAKWLVISTTGFAGGAAAMWNGTPRLERHTWRLWLVLVGVLLASALVNHDVPTALLGQPDRHLGVISWLLFWLLFSAGQRLNERDRRVVTLSMSIGAGALGVYASIELVAGRPIALAASTERLGGTYGSAAFLGAACCLLIPIAIGQSICTRNARWHRTAAAVSAALAMVALIGSGTRAAWLGVAVAGVIAIAVRQDRSREPHRGPRLRIRDVLARRRAGVVAGLAGCLVIALAVTLALRVDDVTQRDHGAASRIDEWTVAVRVLADHPVLGVGPEGYRIASAEGIDAHYEATYGRNATVPDRAHSGVLDVALAGGIGAMVIFVALIGLVLLRAVRLLRHSDTIGRWLGIGVIAYAVQQLFLFPLAEVDPVFWLASGMIVTVSPTTTHPGRVGRPRDSSRPVAIASAALAAIALVVGVLDTAASRLANQSLDSASSVDAISAADRAVDLRPDVITYRLVAAGAHLRRGTLADVDAAIDQARHALQWSPHDPFALDELGVALLRRAIVTGTASDETAALRQWQLLVEADPHRARWQVELGRASA
ncbi:MAG: hypothetical protein JWN39_3690, partial [Ilumatobacteraceae bacterium]|nr:hypothetical protein [Ilumatobacteraceae bacterium]